MHVVSETTRTDTQANTQADTIRRLRLENDTLSQRVNELLSTIERMKKRETSTLKKVQQLMQDVTQYRKQLVS